MLQNSEISKFSLYPPPPPRLNNKTTLQLKRTDIWNRAKFQLLANSTDMEGMNVGLQNNILIKASITTNINNPATAPLDMSHTLVFWPCLINEVLS